MSDFKVFDRIGDNFSSGILLLCDHAHYGLPLQYGSLGLPISVLRRHIGWDIGAGAVVRYLCSSLNCVGIMSCFSRLLIDPNRGIDDPTLIMRIGDGAVIPGNIDISCADRLHRISAYYDAYHGAIDSLIGEFLSHGISPTLISVHSFTPFWKGVRRPWQIGILWDRDDRVSGPLIRLLSSDRSVTVGDNAPYSGSLPGDTMNRHGSLRSLRHVLIELRQDLISDSSGVLHWGGYLSDCLCVLGRDGVIGTGTNNGLA